MKRALITAGPRGLLALPRAASARVVELGAGSSQPVDVQLPGQPVPGRSTRSPGTRAAPATSRTRSSSGATATSSPSPSRSRSWPTTRSTRSTRASAGRPRCASPPLRRGDKRKTRLNHRLLRQSDVFEVENYLGSSPTFVLKEPLRVEEGQHRRPHGPHLAPRPRRRPQREQLVALLAAQGQMRQRRRALAAVRAGGAARGRSATGCTYKGARLLYTATYIPDPRPTKTRKK